MKTAILYHKLACRQLSPERAVIGFWCVFFSSNDHCNPYRALYSEFCGHPNVAMLLSLRTCRRRQMGGLIWRSDPKEDEKHLVDLHKQLFDAMTVNGPAASTFVLNDGTTIVGRIQKIGTGNNGGDGGKWQYYGEVQIVPEGGGDDITLDFMQLKYVL
jgi:hypothetical protein